MSSDEKATSTSTARGSGNFDDQRQATQSSSSGIDSGTEEEDEEEEEEEEEEREPEHQVGTQLRGILFDFHRSSYADLEKPTGVMDDSDNGDDPNGRQADGGASNENANTASSSPTPTSGIGGSSTYSDLGKDCAEQEPSTLLPVDQLVAHSISESVGDRQLVGKLIINIFQNAVESNIIINAEEIFNRVEHIIYDKESSVRSDLVGYLPHIVVVVETTQSLFVGSRLLTNKILNVILFYLRDRDPQVREDAQQALRVLLNEDLLSVAQITDNVCNVIIELSCEPASDLQVLALNLMTKISQYIGPANAEKSFLNRYLELCKSDAVLVKRTCALIIGEFFDFTNNDTINEKLLPAYEKLCLDENWGVRKNCIDVMLSVARAIPDRLRKLVLTRIMISTLQDESRWVQRSAYEILGPFISTFGSDDLSEITGQEEIPMPPQDINSPNSRDIQYDLVYRIQQAIDDKGDEAPSLNFAGGNQSSSVYITSRRKARRRDFMNEQVRVEKQARNRTNSSGDTTRCSVKVSNLLLAKSMPPVKTETEVEQNSEEEDSENFNSFLFYYDPPPVILDDLIIQSIIVENSNSVISSPDNVKREQDEENDNNEEEESASNIEHQNTSNIDNNNVVVERVWISDNQQGRARNEKDNQQQLQDQTSKYFKRYEGSSFNDNSVPVPNKKNYDKDIFNQTELDDTLNVSNVMNDSTESDYEDNNAHFNHANYLKYMANFVDDKERVPAVLVEYFISMVRLQSTAGDVGPDIDYHCAFSFPAVVLTLGKANWHRLKYAYQELASAHAWKVRSTLAASIHEIAVIIERDNAATDLMPIFDGFIKDLEEVRMCALKHFYLFLAVLSPQDRMQYLPKLNDFLITDNKWNWRLRHDLVVQLAKIIPLFENLDVAAYIAPLLLHLMQDKVSAVREAAMEAVTCAIGHLLNETSLALAMLQEMRDLLTASERWVVRQAFALICAQLTGVLSPELFTKELLPSLLSLSTDRVPNVRLVVARTLVRTVIPIPMDVFRKTGMINDIRQNLKTMQADSDRDVRIFANEVDENLLY